MALRDDIPIFPSMPIGYHLIPAGSVEETKITDFLSQQFGVPAINLPAFDVDPKVIALVPKEVCITRVVIPVNGAGSSVIIAMANPADRTAIDEVKARTGMSVEVVVASEEAIRGAIRRYYP